MLIVSWFVCSFLNFLLYSYLFSKIFATKYKFNLILALGISFINAFSMIYNLGYVRPYIVHVYLFFSMLFMYKQKIVKTLLAILYISTIVVFVEMFAGLFLIFVVNVDVDMYLQNWVNYIIWNLLEFILVILLERITFVNKFATNVIDWYQENEFKSLSVFSFLALTIMTFLLYNNFISELPNCLLLITNLFCIAVLIFVIGFFTEKTKNNKIIYKYDQLLDYINVYEKLIEQKSKNQHEYKNQLIMIRDMDKKSDRTKYINDILNIEETMSDGEWVHKLRFIPEGGIKGLIYYKIQSMLNNNINVLLTTSEELNNKKVWVNFSNNLSDVSKIIGVYLDNAIEAVSSLKEKYITISFYLEDDYIVFDITNTYDGSIDINRLDKEGYTTKGNGKGYGLSLVKDIISKNNNLEQKRVINGNYFSQKLYIKK